MRTKRAQLEDNNTLYQCSVENSLIYLYLIPETFFKIYDFDKIINIYYRLVWLLQYFFLVILPVQVHPSQVHPSQVHPSQVHPLQHSFDIMSNIRLRWNVSSKHDTKRNQKENRWNTKSMCLYYNTHVSIL